MKLFLLLILIAVLEGCAYPVAGVVGVNTYPTYGYPGGRYYNPYGGYGYGYPYGAAPYGSISGRYRGHWH